MASLLLLDWAHPAPGALRPGAVLAQASQALVLVSPWKPLVLLAVFGAWAWVVSTVYDKHAARFRLARERWNLIHLIVGLVALVVAVGIPWEHPAAFFVGLAAALAILGIDLYAYAHVANKDERVPESQRIRLDALTKVSNARAERSKSRGKIEPKLRLIAPDKSVLPPPTADTPEAEVRLAAESVYLRAMASRASSVEIRPTGKDQSYAPVFIVDGLQTPGDPLAAQSALAIIDLWKLGAKLDVADRRRKLQGTLDVEHAGAKHRVRITSVGVAGGMRLTMLIDPDGQVRREPAKLGLTDEQFKELRAIVDDPKRGVVLLTTPPDGGRTTLTYSVVQMHDAYTQRVEVLEVDQQLAIEGVRHTPFDPLAEGADFGTTARSLLRRDPDVLAVAELPDANTAKEVAKADTDRTRVYVCFRAGSALEALDSWIKAVGDPKQAARNLRGVVNGRLLRKLCTNCRVEYTPSPEMVQKLGVTDPKASTKLFKKGGQVLIKNKPEVCPVCGGVGFIGQEGIFEVYAIGDEERALVESGNLSAIKAALRKKPLPTLQAAGVAKLLQGVTSLEEFTRVTSPMPAPGAAAPSSPAPQAPPPAKGASATSRR
ncbi:MAG: hypothetical protein C0475_01215 [Planctomyces sp.]|nr:hypothetical protein [Planctomyces sp.]